MTDQAIRDILELVSEGRLTAAEAEPILDALERAQRASKQATRAAETATTYSSDGSAPAASKASSDGARARALRIEVTESGRAVVNLRVPLALGRAALDRIPGLSESIGDRVRDALASGIQGPIVDIDDDGDGVRITLE